MKKAKYTDGRPKLQRDWEGKKVRSLRDMSNHYHALPAGTEFIVTSVSWKGMSLKMTKTCSECGVGERVHISGIDGTDVEFLPETPV